jgi:hypothetical protein
MKNKIKDILSIFSLILIFAFFQGSYQDDSWRSFNFIVQILILTIIIFCGQYFTKKFESPYRILELGLEFLMVAVVVLVYGQILRWYQFPDVLPLLWIIVLVYIISYFLDIVKTKKDVSDVNKLIQLRRAEQKINPNSQE